MGNAKQIIANVEPYEGVTVADLKECLAVVEESLRARVDETGDGPDKIVKGPRFVDFLLGRALPTLVHTPFEVGAVTA